MNSISLHLISGMFPFFALLIGIFLFVVGLLKGDKSIKMTSLFLFLLASVCLLWLYVTGEKAAFALKDYAGIHLEGREKHEFWGILSMGSAAVLLFFSCIFFFKILFKREKQETANENTKIPTKSNPVWGYVVLLTACLTLASISVTSYYGLQMRHQEIEAQPKFWH